MKQVSKLTRGIIGLIIAAMILLVSDFSNRQTRDNTNKIVPGKKLKFCLAHYVDSPNSENCQDGIFQGLKDMGLEEGIHFTLRIFNAQGDISSLNSIAGTISSSKWDLIFATSTPTIQALSQKVKNMPVVFTNVGDPVKAGLGESFEKHNPGMTGVSTMSDFNGMTKMIKVIHPNAQRIGTIFTPAEINSVAYKERLEEAAVAHNLELVAVPANTATEVYDAAVSLSLKNIDAFCQISDNLTASCSSSIIKVSRNSKIPYYAFITKQVAQGAIAAAARDYFQAGYDAAVMGKRILDGENPASIPYQYVTKTVYTINEEAAAFFNVTIPKSVMNKAKHK
jgi:ABC-type uncharacterized transport system substrate-binding protein